MLGALLLLSVLAGGCLRKWPAYYAPTWAPDGKRLYYVAAQCDGTLALRDVDLATGKSGGVAASRFPVPPVAMALSPRGDKVACAVIVPGKPPVVRLHVLSAGGQGDRAVWEAPCERGIADLCWTPDGRSLVVAVGSSGGSRLCQVPADGQPPRVVAADLADVRAPTVSPDGRRVAFLARAEPGGLWSLYVAALDSGARKQLVPDLFADYAIGYWPAWAPRGDSVAYVAEHYLCSGFADLCACDAKSGHCRVLAQAVAGACIAPAWSPSGDALAFVRLPFGTGPDGPGTGGHPADIVAVDANGENERTLVADGLANLMPSWSPDGRTLAFGTCDEPAGVPHVVRLADLATNAVRLAERAPEADFALAWARLQRGNAGQAGIAAAAAGRLKDPAFAAQAHRMLAQHYTGEGQWAPAADQARAAANAAQGDRLTQALRLLAAAQMRLGDPKGALASAEQILAHGPDPEAAALRQRLAEGIAAAAKLEAEISKAPAPALRLRLAEVQLRQLGDPRKAIATLFRLAEAFPDAPEVKASAPLIFACYEQLGAKAASYRVLLWAAAAIGEGTLEPAQVVLMAETAAANGQSQAALRLLDGLPQAGLPAPLHRRAIVARLRAAEQFEARGETSEAVATYRSAAAGAPTALTARASLEAGKLLVRAGEHWEATECLLGALVPQAEPITMREAVRLLTAGRLHRRDPLAYDVARVAELAAFGYLDAAVSLGELTLSGLPQGDPRRTRLQGHLAVAYRKLVGWHLARRQVPAAQAVLDRWQRLAARAQDLPLILAQLAACHRLDGNRRALVETLSRLALECAGTPEAAEARRELLQLDTQERSTTPLPRR